MSHKRTVQAAASICLYSHRILHFRVQGSVSVPHGGSISNTSWLFSNPYILWDPLSIVLDLCELPYLGWIWGQEFLHARSSCVSRGKYLSLVSLIIEALHIHRVAAKLSWCSHSSLLEDEVVHLEGAGVEASEECT